MLNSTSDQQADIPGREDLCRCGLCVANCRFLEKSAIRHTQGQIRNSRCERFMISNWCLTASDSAATVRTPPGRAKTCESDQQVGNQNEQQPHWGATFHCLALLRKSALSHDFLPELPIRHTQV